MINAVGVCERVGAFTIAGNVGKRIDILVEVDLIEN